MKATKWLKSILVTTCIVMMCGMTVCAAPKKMADGGTFDAEYYAATYPDVVAVLGKNEAALYNHYKMAGQAEGRLPYAGATAAAAQAATTATNAAKAAVAAVPTVSAIYPECVSTDPADLAVYMGQSITLVPQSVFGYIDDFGGAAKNPADKAYYIAGDKYSPLNSDQVSTIFMDHDRGGAISAIILKYNSKYNLMGIKYGMKMSAVRKIMASKGFDDCGDVFFDGTTLKARNFIKEVPVTAQISRYYETYVYTQDGKVTGMEYYINDLPSYY